MGSEVKPPSELHCPSNRDGHDHTHFSRSREVSSTKNVALEAVSVCEQKRKRGRREGRAASFEDAPSLLIAAGQALGVCRERPTPGGGRLKLEEEGRSRGQGRV